MWPKFGSADEPTRPNTRTRADAATPFAQQTTLLPASRVYSILSSSLPSQRFASLSLHSHPRSLSHQLFSPAFSPVAALLLLIPPLLCPSLPFTIHMHWKSMFESHPSSSCRRRRRERSHSRSAPEHMHAQPANSARELNRACARVRHSRSTSTRSLHANVSKNSEVNCMRVVKLGESDGLQRSGRGHGRRRCREGGGCIVARLVRVRVRVT